MSTRFGMADGRCFTDNTSSRLLNDLLAQKNGIDVRDSYTYRMALQHDPSKFVVSGSQGCQLKFQ